MPTRGQTGGSGGVTSGENPTKVAPDFTVTANGNKVDLYETGQIWTWVAFYLT